MNGSEGFSCPWHKCVYCCMFCVSSTQAWRMKYAEGGIILTDQERRRSKSKSKAATAKDPIALAASWKLHEEALDLPELGLHVPVASRRSTCRLYRLDLFKCPYSRAQETAAGMLFWVCVVVIAFCTNLVAILVLRKKKISTRLVECGWIFLPEFGDRLPSASNNLAIAITG